MTKQINLMGGALAIVLASADKYVAGYVLNEAEASVLAQTFAENVRNNLNGKIKAAQEAATKAGIEFSIDSKIGGEGDDKDKTFRDVFQAYADNYVFGVRSDRVAEPVDPVEREARVIGRDMLSAALKAKNVKRKDLTDEQYEAALQAVSAREEVVAEAKRRVKIRGNIGTDELLGGLGIGTDSAPATEA